MMEIYNKPPDKLPIRSDHYFFDLANNIVPDWFRRSTNSKKMIAAYLHYHLDIEFIYLLRGHLSTEVNSCTFELSPGDLLIINPYEPHCATFDAGEVVEYYFVAFDFTCFTRLVRSIADKIDKLRLGKLWFPNVVRKDKAAELGDLIYEIQRGMRDGSGTADDLMQLSRLFRLMSLLIDRVGLCDTAKRKPETRDFDFMNKVMLMIEANFKQPLSTAAAAAKLGYNESYFCTLFKRCFGLSFTNYLSYYRINRAASFYHNSELRPSEIAELVGFSDYSHFSRTFHKQVGVPPSMYFKLDNPPPAQKK